MRKIVICISTLLFSASVFSVSAAAEIEDPVAVRKALMQAVAASAGTSSAMLRGNREYDMAVAKAAIATFHASAKALSSFFPENSHTGGTTAAPTIWKDPEAFGSAVAKFRAAAATAVDLAGHDGPADLEAFRQAVTPVLGNCSSCHQSFRVQN
ncbi:cytochrome c [Chelativorans sp. Marseille-P2723]|uniref:c-type cytochrome n=1 Tax=Chelativorans sp. Marseille-P2723 TaxID=2709133 RepID=UPI00156F7AC4|nr:cytochrome c [Chelativorans sp. Marseille-P2723]